VSALDGLGGGEPIIPVAPMSRTFTVFSVPSWVCPEPTGRIEVDPATTPAQPSGPARNSGSPPMAEVCQDRAVSVTPGALVAFLVGSVLVTVIPGPDMALITRQVLVGGTALAQRTIFGNLTGLLVHGVALAAGLSALLVLSATAYTAVKLAGAAYLGYLGVQALWAARHRPAAPASLHASPGVPPGRAEPAAPVGRLPSRRAFLPGLVSTVLNPKPALFFLTFLPQFVDPRQPVLPQTSTLAAIHVLVGLVWLSVYARLVDRARGVLTAPTVRAWLERTTGVVLLAFGVRVAVERR
jgi:threonine/homoserine/homoserine lactone efflux protein